MPHWVADLVIAFLILLMTYVLSSEGLWGAALVFFNVLFSGIIAFNFYEPLAALLSENVGFLAGFADTLCLMSIFIVSLTLFRLTTDSIAPAMVRFPLPIYHLGRFFFGLAATVTALSIMILAFETAPVHQKVLSSIDYKSKPPFGLGLDHHWLSFFQYTTGQVFADYRPGEYRDPHGEYGSAKVFDPRAEWLLNHQKARPYGDHPVLEGGDEGGAEKPAADAAAKGAGAL
jgi:hypothetical protein